MEKENVILDLTFRFALGIIEYAEVLEENRKYVIAKQLLKSGTSVGANTNEAQSAESKADFIHKLKIADKEAKETAYWLKLCHEAPTYPKPSLELINRINDILNVLSKIIITARNKS